MTTRKKSSSLTSDSAPLSTPTVTTDQSDYAPGSTATFTASGFAAGSTVAFEVEHATGAGADNVWGTPDDVLNTNTGEGHEPWYVTDGGAGDLDGKVNGSITTSWYVNPDDSVGATFLLTAASAGADGVSGTADDAVATTSFTDSVLNVLATGVNVTLDETTGLQNGAAADDDNDILVASLPSAFSARLTALGAGAVAEAALSGYTGAAGNTGSNAFSITAAPGGGITDISFVGSTGAPLNGLDSGLDTLDGTAILLYTDTNNNIVLGRAGGSTGAIVFAAYIEETGSPVTGGKIWTVQYEPLKHPDTSNPDDAVNLLNKVFIGATQDLEFSLAGAPSGQNLFLMFTKLNPTTEIVDGVTRITDPTIIATGKNPADQSSGANITTGDTINTSQAGGPTTFGTNNQMIVEQEGIRFSFVTGARQNVTIPNLDQNEADLESNVDFTGVFNVKMATFDVVQLQSGKSAVVRISAFSTAAEPGVNFINGYAGDTSVAITNVRVINISTGLVIENSDGTVNSSSIVISFSGGVATITGVLAGYKIEYTTTLDHNRVLVENGAALDAKGNNHADFDIGGFKLIQAFVATAEIGSKIIFEDDGPSADVIDGGGVVTIDETADNQDNDSDAAAVLALFDTEVLNKGTDLSPTEFAISTTPLATTLLSSFGQDQEGATKVLSLAIVGGNGTDSLLDTTDGKNILLFKEGDLIVGRYDVANGVVTVADPAAFAIALLQDGNVAVAQYVSLTHPVAGSTAAAHDDRIDLTGLINAVVTVTDGDGDTSTDSVGIGDDINFDDDGPSADVIDGGGSVTIDETAGNQDDDSDAAAVLALFDTEVANPGTDLNPAEFAISTTPLATTLLSSFGQDQEGATKVLSLAIVGGDGTDSLLNTTDGKNILLFKEGDLIVGRYDVTNGVVTVADPAAFAIALLQDGNVAVAQYVSLTHPVAGSTAAAHDDRVDLTGLINAVVTVTDGDGDTSTDSVGIGDDINFDDDGPSADVIDGGGVVTIDETAGNQDNDSDAAAVLALFDTEVANPGTDLNPAEFAISTTPLATTLLSSFGQDQEGATKVLSLAIVGGNGTDSLLDTTDGKNILLFKEGDLIVGRYDVTNGVVTIADPAAFAIALLQDGNVAVAQYVSLTHPVAGSTAAAHDDRIDLTGLINAVVTVTDGDGDTSTDSVGIGDDINFDDDGPSADVIDGGGSVTIDETAGNQDDDSDAAAVLALFDTEVLNKGTDLSPTEFAISTTPLATTLLSSFGQDQEGATKVLSLAIVGGNGTDSLLDTTDGKNILLFKEGDLIVGRYDVANGVVTVADPAAFAIALLQDGNVAVAQYVSLTHPVAGSTAAAHDDRIDLTGLINAVVTVTDGDGDTSTDSVGIGDDINFDDDGPSADVIDGGGSVTIDETAGNQDDDSDAAAVLALFDTEVLNKGTDLSPTEFAISTTPLATTLLSSFGQDQEGATKVLSLAIVGGNGTDSLLDTTDGKNILLFKEGDLIVGRYDVANGVVTVADPAAFAIALLQDGNVAVAQYVSLTHPVAGSTAAAHDDRIDLTGLINAVVTVTDGDGDTSTDSVGIGDDINFDDDGPSADVIDGGGSVTIDETAGNQDDDSDAAAVLALFDTEVLNKGTDLSPTEFAISTTPLATTLLSSFGQDQEGATKVLSLAIVGGNGTDSLLDTTDGKNILLFKEGDLIVGRYDVANGVVTVADPAAFAIALLQDGNVAVAQYVSLTHPVAGSTAAAHDDRVDLTGLINAVVTVTDGDGDTSTDSVGIGDDINFDDDGPAVSANNTVLLDDDALSGNPGGTGDDADSANVSGTLGHDFGQDGAGTVAYLTSGAPTGFTYVADATSLLVKQGTTTVLTLTMVAATGVYTVVQNNPILHAAGLTENNQEFTINYRVTDGDGDTADGTLGINVDDDTPVVTAKSNLVYANTSNGGALTDLGGTGVFAYSIGADLHVAPYSATNSDFLSVALTGVTVGANAITNKTVTWVSETNSQAVFNVGFTYVSNNPAQGATTNATGTLIFDKVADTYTLKLAQEIESFSILNTSTPGNPLQGYALNSATTVGANPPVSVMTLASNFFVQFEGFGVDNGTPQTFAYDTGTGLFSNDRRYVTVSSDSIGAASDTLQSDEVIDLDFYKTNPLGFTDSAAIRATSKAIFLEFTQAGPGAGKDMLVVLKLVDDITGTTINRTFIVGNSDGNDDVFNADLPAYGFVAQAQNGIVVFESNDYNFAGEHYSIQGAQVVTSTQLTSGTGFQLNGAIDNPATPGAEGATTNAQIAFGGATTEQNNEPIKIVNIGFVSTATPDAHLTFDVVLADADSDATATQTLDVTIVGDNRVTASTGADTFVIADTDVDGLLSMVSTVINGGFATGTDKLDFTTAGSVANYTEVLAPATNLAAFTAAADIVLDTKNYYFGVVGGDGYLAFDGDGNGITTIIQLVGVTNIESTDIV